MLTRVCRVRLREAFIDISFRTGRGERIKCRKFLPDSTRTLGVQTGLSGQLI